MRTGVEIARQVGSLEELEQQVRHTGADLTHALQQVPVFDQVAWLDQELVKDIRYNIAEALRLNACYRRRLCDRLAGSPTPSQGSSPQSHDPPFHAPGSKQEEPITP